jgi:SAM-dependent methyltransferase
MYASLQTANETTLPGPLMAGLGDVRILHPPGTFALSPASLISVQAIVGNQDLLKGIGLDWGTGSGCLAITAARIADVFHVAGLDISETSVAIARQNASSNAVNDKTSFFVSNSYSPVDWRVRRALDSLVRRVDFVLANPPASEHDDGFGFRREVLKGARKYMAAGGVVLLGGSSRYGQRAERLCDEVPEFSYGGVISSTGWVPFDLARPDYLRCLQQYAAEEERGGLTYRFQCNAVHAGEPINARRALSLFVATGLMPFMDWQMHLFKYNRN